MNTPPKKDGLGELLRTFFIAVLLAVIFRSFAFEPFHIPSGSMKSTLLVGDYLFVSKYSYGYSRYSFPFGFPLFEGRIGGHVPERGDVVVFRLPRSPSIDYIKRLIGLPGDHIQMKHGILYINDKAVSLRAVDNFVDNENMTHGSSLNRYIETLPNGKEHVVLDEKPYGNIGPSGFDSDNTDVYTVPDGHYFMMGDNRDNSTDSRYQEEVGFVPAENIVGRAELILFSGHNCGEQSWAWWRCLRTERFFKRIE